MRFAFLSPRAADSFSSNNPSPKTGVRDIEQAEKIATKMTLVRHNIRSNHMIHVFNH
jgi:hypothetical protein